MSVAGSTATAMEVDDSGMSDVFESEATSSSFAVEADDEDDDETSEAVFPSVSSDSETPIDLNNFGDVPRRGIIWKKYRPIKKKTIYSRILHETEDIRTIIQELIALFRTNSRQAVASLLQFCMDVSGLQKFDITDYYITEMNVKRTLIKVTELMSNDKEYVESGNDTAERYLLLENHTLAKYLQLKIYTFLQDFIQAAYTEGLLRRGESHLTDFFDFIKYMLIQRVRAIYHTAVVFCVKIITAVVEINVVNMDEDDNNTNVLLVQFLYVTLTKSLHFDKRSHSARVELCRQMWTWCECMPYEFFTRWNSLRYIMKLIHDPSAEVRVMILKVFQKLMKYQKTFDYLTTKDMEEDTKKVVDRISERFLDVNDTVAMEAVRVFAVLQGREGMFDRFLERKCVEDLGELIFNTSFDIAQAACEFIYKFFMNGEQGAIVNVLNSIAVTTYRHPFGPELLVEGCLQIVPDIRNWSLYIKILSEKRETFDEHAIVILFAEAVTQVLRGHSSKPRRGSPTVDADPAEHNRIAQHFPQLVNLVSNFRREEKILKEIFKIFSIAKPTTNHNEDYMVLCDLIEPLFVNAVDKQLLKEIVSTLDNLCDNVYFRDSAKLVEKRVVHRCFEQFRTFLTDPMPDESGEMENSIIVNQALVLYEHGKFTKEITWSLLFDALSNFELEVLTDLLICCKWHLIWTLKRLKKPKTDRNTVDQQLCNLLTSVKSYTTLLFKLLTDLEVDVLRVKVYKTTCEFYTCWNNIVRPLISSDKQYEELLLTNEPSMKTILIPFVEEYIIKNTELSLKERQEGIIACIEMVNKGIIPFSCLVHVYKYYNQYLLEYGPIIKGSLKALGELDDSRNLHLIVMATVKNGYDAIIDKYGSIDMTITEVKALKTLTKRLLDIESFRKSNKDSLKSVLLIAIEYSRKNKWSFLFFARYFLNLITDPSHFDYLLNILKQLLNGQQRKPDELLWFIKQVKQIKRGKGSKTGKNVPDPVEVEDEDIEDNIENLDSPVEESTPKTPYVKKRKTKESTSSDRMVDTSAANKQQDPQSPTPKGRPRRKKTGQTSKPVYSKSSEGAIEILDDSD